MLWRMLLIPALGRQRQVDLVSWRQPGLQSELQDWEPVWNKHENQLKLSPRQSDCRAGFRVWVSSPALQTQNQTNNKTSSTESFAASSRWVLWAVRSAGLIRQARRHVGSTLLLRVVGRMTNRRHAFNSASTYLRVMTRWADLLTGFSFYFFLPSFFFGQSWTAFFLLALEIELRSPAWVYSLPMR